MLFDRRTRCGLESFLVTCSHAVRGAHGQRHLFALAWLVCNAPFEVSPEARRWAAEELPYHEAMRGRLRGLVAVRDRMMLPHGAIVLNPCGPVQADDLNSRGNGSG